MVAIVDLFDRGWRGSPQSPALVKGKRRLTFDEVRRTSLRIAGALRRDGVPRGTKVAVLSPNDPAAWIAVLGLWRAGMVWVPMNPATPPHDVLRLVTAFDCEVVLFHASLSGVVAELRRALGPGLRCIGIDAEPLEEWIDGIDAADPALPYDEDDVVAIASTGGTTGPPKGVMNTHRSFAACFAHAMIAMPYGPDEPIVNLVAAPMTHAAGILSVPATARGGTVVMLDRPEPRAVLESIEAHRVTELFLPPTVVYRLLEAPEIGDHDLSSLRYLIYGAAPMSTGKLRRALETFGPVLIECYGQVEAFAGIAFLRPEEHLVDGQIAPDSRLTSCGRPAPLISVEVRDDADRPVPAGRTGEICVRGDLVMKGYYNAPEQTATTIVDGWLHTGDLGHFDAEGYLHLTDRKRDMIISGGFNVYPSDVEQVIWSHPSVQDCAVIGVPHEDWGEAVTAVVELNPGARATAAELVDLCREALGSVKAPKSVDFVTSLPRSANGKVLKKAVRAWYEGAGS